LTHDVQANVFKSAALRADTSNIVFWCKTCRMWQLL